MLKVQSVKSVLWVLKEPLVLLAVLVRLVQSVRLVRLVRWVLSAL